MHPLTIERINPSDINLIQLVADWYNNMEWKIEPSITITRLSDFANIGLPCHLLVKHDGTPVATGGLYADLGIGLLRVFPEYKKHPYWISLVYTLPEFRGQGIAAFLCKAMEQLAKQHGLTKLNLYTNTAEKLYLREGWTPLERVIYKDSDTVIMEKDL